MARRPWQDDKIRGFSPRSRHSMVQRDGRGPGSGGGDRLQYTNHVPRPTLCAQRLGFDAINVVFEMGGTGTVDFSSDHAFPVDIGGKGDTGLRVNTFIHFTPGGGNYENTWWMLDIGPLSVEGGRFVVAMVNVYAVMVDWNPETITWGTKPVSNFRGDPSITDPAALTNYSGLFNDLIVEAGGGFDSPVECGLGDNSRAQTWGKWPGGYSEGNWVPPVNGCHPRAMYGINIPSGSYGLCITTENSTHARNYNFLASQITRFQTSGDPTADFDCAVTMPLYGVEIEGDLGVTAA